MVLREGRREDVQESSGFFSWRQRVEATSLWLGPTR